MLLSIDQGWYVLIAAFLAGWLILFKNSKKPNIKNDLTLGLIVLVVSAGVEFFAVSNGLWNYAPKNWPWQLWLSYFTSGMLFYQIVHYFTK